MYPLTIGLAIENRDLLEQTQACLGTMPFRVIVEHQDLGDISTFVDRLERTRRCHVWPAWYWAPYGSSR